jgi:hypothetical protein
MKYTRKSFSVPAGGTDEYRAGYDAIDWGSDKPKPGDVVTCDKYSGPHLLDFIGERGFDEEACCNPRKCSAQVAEKYIHDQNSIT